MSHKSRNSGLVALNQPDLFSFARETGSRSSVMVPVAALPSNLADRATQASQDAANHHRLPLSAFRSAGCVDMRPRPPAIRSERSPSRLRPVEPPVRMLTWQDMPIYPPDLIASAKRSIKEIATDRVLLTYKEIDAFFGISRATVARRLKDGLVPGIRIRYGRVLADGPVRRLDRTQVLYLLLAVRGRSSK